MRKFTLGAMVCLLMGCGSVGAFGQKQAAQKSPRLFVEFGYSSEGTYQRVVIEDTTLRSTYNQRNSLEKPGDHGAMIAQRPHWTNADLVTETVVLSAVETRQLEQIIRQTHFFSLKPVYGERHGRAYPTGIHVRLGKKEHSVAFLSGLHSGKRPTAFVAVENKLVQLVNSKCKHKIPR